MYSSLSPHCYLTRCYPAHFVIKIQEKQSSLLQITELMNRGGLALKLLLLPQLPSPSCSRLQSCSLCFCSALLCGVPHLIWSRRVRRPGMSPAELLVDSGRLQTLFLGAWQILGSFRAAGGRGRQKESPTWHSQRV